MGKKWVTDFNFWGSKITAYGDCSHEIKRHLLFGRKAMTNLDRILKSKDITLSAKVCLVKAMVFPVVVFGCESWTIKKAECQRIDAFELWYWRRLLRVPWTARRSNQSILKEILNIHWKDWCWGWNSNTLDTWCEELTHLKRPSCGKDWRQEEKGMIKHEMIGWHHWLDGHESEQALRVGDGQGILACCSPWGRKESDMTEWLNWTELIQKLTQIINRSRSKMQNNDTFKRKHRRKYLSPGVRKTVLRYNQYHN